MTEQKNTNDLATADVLYADLQDIWRQAAADEGHDSKLAYRRAYWQLNRCLQRLLNEKTAFAGVRFNGAFAKTDYLLKEYHAPRYLQHSVNDARVRMRKLRERSDDELKEHFAYDMKAVCQLIALVCQVPVSAVLEARFPKGQATATARLKAEYLRIIVNHWDDSCLYANADEADADELTVFYGGKSPHAVYADWDWSYLRPLLHEGCQLNIIRPREKDGVLYPELFIFEPDFLVDISAIAACFESYAVSPRIHLLNKLKPAESTQPQVLGHLASQFLDESLCLGGAERPYGESVQNFFRGNAVSLLTAPLGQDFHAQAQSQQHIISDTLRRKLPEVLQEQQLTFDNSNAMVEPSFFSEMLGIQGRMDFLQLDQKVLIEQKSGKARYPESDPPRQQDKHYVQLLLYMLLLRYNYRKTYDANGRRLFAFLLYSKYRNGLLPLGFAPELVFDALKVRNEMAAAEYSYSREGMGLLTTLSADSLNENHVHGPLWEVYQKPQIDALLTPVRQATPLERAYYLRFLKFIATEHLLAKVGSQTRENAGFADKWLSSLDDKLLAGNIYCGMDLVSPAANDDANVSRIELAFTEQPDHEISNFRTSDIVILYPYDEGDEPDARRTMVFRATIVRITADRVLLSLRATQVNANAFWHGGKRKWAIEHDFFDSSFSSLYRGMHAFLSAPQERRDLLLLQRPPKSDQRLTLVGDYGSFNTLALRAKQARDLFLIIGPPGTGKTSYGLLNTLKEELASGDGSVLLLSYTNRAVDEICSKLIDSGIDFIRVGGRFACDDSCRPYLLDSRINTCAKIGQLRDVITATRVFVGTTTAFNAAIGLFKLKTFSLAIIDEASQILEPHLIGLLSATTDDGSCAIRKMVLIGDHKQLPAVVQQNAEESAVDDPLLHAVRLTNCRLSLFERLLRQYRDDPAVTYMLTRQGRMHHDIASFPNKAFYQGRLQEVPLPHQERPLPPSTPTGDTIADMLATQRVAFMAIPATERRISDKVNTNEAKAIAATAVKIYEQNRDTFSPQKTLGIIVPYRNQIAEIRNCIGDYGIDALRDITIDTVERFQGSQRDHILYGFTVQKRYQLAFLTDNVFEEDGYLIDRKLNVAMTRAREHLVLFGNPELLATNSVFADLIDFTKSRNCYYSEFDKDS